MTNQMTAPLPAPAAPWTAVTRTSNSSSERSRYVSRVAAGLGSITRGSGTEAMPSGLILRPYEYRIIVWITTKTRIASGVHRPYNTHTQECIDLTIHTHTHTRTRTHTHTRTHTQLKGQQSLSPLMRMKEHRHVGEEGGAMNINHTPKSRPKKSHHRQKKQRPLVLHKPPRRHKPAHRAPSHPSFLPPTLISPSLCEAAGLETLFGEPGMSIYRGDE